MKKRKREKLNKIKEERRKEWERVKEFQEFEKTVELLQDHFDLIEMNQREGGLSFPRDFDKFTCEGCLHYKNEECKGKGLRGEKLLKCLRKPKHRDCGLI